MDDGRVDGLVSIAVVGATVRRPDTNETDCLTFRLSDCQTFRLF